MAYPNDPCPSCDGDQYDEAAGECSECGFELDAPTPYTPWSDCAWDLWKPIRDC